MASNSPRLQPRFSDLDISNIYDYLLYLLILSSPLIIYGILVFGMSARLSRIFLILLLPLMLVKIGKKPSLILRDKFLIFGFLPYSLYTSLSILWTPVASRAFGINRLGALYEVVFVYILFIVADFNISKFQTAIKYYIASSVIPLLVAFWQIVNNITRFNPTEAPFQSWIIPGRYEVLRDHIALIKIEKYSRITSTFAEPTIFGTFLSSVLLLSLLVETKSHLATIGLRVFQIILLLCIFVSLSKLAFVTLALALLIILRKYKKPLMIFLGLGAILLLSSYFVIEKYYVFDFLRRRFFTDSGHLVLLKRGIDQILSLSVLQMIFGRGIGSIPEMSTNKFLLSRIFESGIFGLLFALYVSILPFKVLHQKIRGLEFEKINNVCLGLLGAVIIGFHLYDNFIYLWPWMVIGMIMSLYYNLEANKA